jgi:hypothetical protein
MSEAFHMGGWGMYPTTIAGFILVLCASRFAWKPARERLPLVLWLGALVSLTSALGFVAGVIKTLTAAGQLSGNEAIGAVTAGIGESANNLGLGLSLLVMATIAVVIGQSRRRATGAELVDPLR